MPIMASMLILGESGLRARLSAREGHESFEAPDKAVIIPTPLFYSRPIDESVQAVPRLPKSAITERSGRSNASKR